MVSDQKRVLARLRGGAWWLGLGLWVGWGAAGGLQAAELEGLVREALVQHPLVLSAQQQRVASAQEIEGARWQFFPTPSVSLEQSNQSSTLFSDSRLQVYRLQQPLWSGGRLTGQVSRAEANKLVADAALEEVRQDLTLRVVVAWSSLQAAALKLQAYQKSMATHLRLLRQVERRKDEGASPLSDVMLAKSRLEAVRADEANTQMQIDTALEQLSQLAGRRVQAAELAGDHSEVAASNRPIDEVVAQALARAPSVAKVQARILAQEAEVAIAKAGYWPEVYARLEKKNGDVNRYKSTAYIGLEASLGAGLSKQSSVSVAQSRLEAMQTDMQSQSRSVTEQVRSDYMQWVNSVRRTAFLAAAFAASEDVAESWSRQFLSGRKSWQEVMNAAREQAHNEAQLADVRAMAVVAAKRLVIYTEGVDGLLTLAALKEKKQ